MGTLAQRSLLSLVLRVLPGPVLRGLDAWSHRVARRRWEQRQAKWQERKAPAAVESRIDYQLKPWRD